MFSKRYVDRRADRGGTAPMTPGAGDSISLAVCRSSIAVVDYRHGRHRAGRRLFTKSRRASSQAAGSRGALGASTQVGRPPSRNPRSKRRVEVQNAALARGGFATICCTPAESTRAGRAPRAHRARPVRSRKSSICGPTPARRCLSVPIAARRGTKRCPLDQLPQPRALPRCRASGIPSSPKQPPPCCPRPVARS